MVIAQEAKKKESSKRVHFAKPIIQPSPKVKSNPNLSISFGSFTCMIDPTNPMKQLTFGSRVSTVSISDPPMNTAPSQARAQQVHGKLNSNILGRVVRCFRCLDLGHIKRFCQFRVRCANCRALGHIKRRCPKILSPRPTRVWRPKSISTKVDPCIQWRPVKPIMPCNQRFLENENTEKQILDSRATEPDTTASDIAIDETIQHGQDNDSSSSSDASSLNEERARFHAIQSRCATVRPFHTKSLPGSSSAGPSATIMQPILIERSNMTDDNAAAPTGLEIVPWRPVLDAITLQLWPMVLSANRQAARNEQSSPEANSLVLTITEERVVVSEGPMANAITILPILIEGPQQVIQHNMSPTGLEIVPRKMTPDALALELWPMFDAAIRFARKQATAAKAPALIIDQNGIVHERHEDRSSVILEEQESQSGPPLFEFHSGEFRPSPDKGKGPMPSPSKNKRMRMTLPTTASFSDSRTPLIQRSVRRSTRIRGGNEGYRHVRIEKSKRSKNWIIEIDEETGKPGPISLSTLQEWGFKYGVDPEDLTADVLMQEPSAPTPAEDNDE